MINLIKENTNNIKIYIASQKREKEDYYYLEFKNKSTNKSSLIEVSNNSGSYDSYVEFNINEGLGSGFILDVGEGYCNIYSSKKTGLKDVNLNDMKLIKKDSYYVDGEDVVVYKYFDEYEDNSFIYPNIY